MGANALLLILGVPLGFFASGIFSGFGSFLAELYPSRARGAGQGFTYNFGRAVGAFFPAIVGFLSVSIGLAGAVAFLQVEEVGESLKKMRTALIS